MCIQETDKRYLKQTRNQMHWTEGDLMMFPDVNMTYDNVNERKLIHQIMSHVPILGCAENGAMIV